jgi:hypothetical protein
VCKVRTAITFTCPYSYRNLPQNKSESHNETFIAHTHTQKSRSLIFFLSTFNKMLLNDFIYTLTLPPLSPFHMVYLLERGLESGAFWVASREHNS